MFDETYPSDIVAAAGQSQKEREYWLNKLSGNLVKGCFPYDQNKPAADPEEKYMEATTFSLSGELFSKLMWITNQSDIRLLVILVAGLTALLEKYTAGKDITLGTPIYMQAVEGNFINTVLTLRNQLEVNTTFKELLYRVKQTLDEAIENQNYPLKPLLYELNLTFSENDFPLFDTAVILENIQDKKYIRHIHPDMVFTFKRTDELIRGVVEYNASRYYDRTIEIIIAHFKRLLLAALQEVNTPLARLEILSQEEKNRVLSEFNNTDTQYPRDKTLHRLFEEQVEKRPEQVAVSYCIDLSDIIEDLHQDNDETMNDYILERYGSCCFKKNPYVFRFENPGVLKDLGLFDGTEIGNAIMIKTHRNNYVCVNSEVLFLLEHFDGRTNVKSMFGGLCKNQKKTGFWLCSLLRNDYNEVSVSKKETFKIDGQYKTFVRLLKGLWNLNVIQLVDFGSEQLTPDIDTDSAAVPERLAEISTGTLKTAPSMHAQKEKQKSPVLLLGGTGGEEFGMDNTVKTFEDFLNSSRLNLKEAEYPSLVNFNHPYIYHDDDRLNSETTRPYIGTNKKIEERKQRQSKNLVITRHITYKELDEKANQLARRLREKGVKPDTTVGMLLSPSKELIVGIFGILKAGGAYMPIDPEIPGNRKEYILKDSGTHLLLTDDGVNPSSDFIPGGIDVMNIGKKNAYDEDGSPLEPVNEPTDLVYVIYTSGSTGNPKGVLVEHHQAVNTLVCRKEEYKMDSDVTALQLFSYAFDGFVTGFFTPIISGGRVVLLSKESIADIEKIIDIMVANRVNHFISIPVLYQVIMGNISSEDASLLKVVTLAGDKLHPNLLEMTAEKNKNLEIANEYGITEATVMSTIHRHQEKDPVIKIGKPAWNTAVYITKTDDFHQLMPIGIYGEMCIGGVGVARGYMNRPELTAEKFVANPFVPDQVMLKSGDMGKWMPDGNLEFGGRMDSQVKVRGFRIEMGEIEKRLLEFPDVKETVVTVMEESSGDKSLCAYIVSGRKIEVHEFREHLSGALPEYMIPAYFIPLEKLPLSPNGKIDRKRLPLPDVSAGINTYVAPRDRVEEQLVKIWANVLGIDKDTIGIDSNFFEMGGHSLKATILSNRIHKELKIKIPMTEFFRAPDIRSISQYIKRAPVDIYASIESAARKDYYALSSSQARLYLLQQLDLTSTAYNVPMFMELEGIPDREKLGESFRELIRRHESLRTSFEIKDKRPVQKIHEEVEFEIVYHSTASLEGILKDFVRPFDLSRAPLIRVELIKTEEFVHVLVVDMHHIITDGVSHKLMIENFISLYTGNPLPPLRLQYKDYSEWRQSPKVKDAFKQQEAFWLREFREDVPLLDIPTDFNRPAVHSSEGSILHFNLDEHETDRLNQLAYREEATLFMVLLAAYNLLLFKISGQETIVVGTPAANRRHADLEQVIGVFINMLPLKNSPGEAETFSHFLQDLKKRTLSAFENQDYPYEELVEKAVLERNMSRNPLFDTVFVLQNMFDASRMLPEQKIADLKIRPYTFERKTSQFDLTLTAVETGNRLSFTFEYCTRLFKKETTERFIDYFKTVTAQIIGNPHKKISSVEIITVEEKNRILCELNRTDVGYPRDKTIHQLFEEQAAKTPENIALNLDGTQLKYKELNDRANRLAGCLENSGFKADTIAALMVAPSIEMIVGIIGILKAGGTYLPIDPDSPENRITYMLADSNARILLTTRDLSVRATLKTEIIYLENDKELHTPHSVPHVDPGNLAYIIYTSGTTGKPKGVMIEHRNVVRLLFNNENLFNFSADDVWTMFHSYCFDFSVWEMYGALLNGGKLIVIPKMISRDPGEFLKLLQREGVTVLNQTPPAFYNLLSEELKIKEKKLVLRYVIFGGEALAPAGLKEWKKRYPRTKLINMYGITETTVHVTFKEIEEKEIRENRGNIGGPIPTLSTFVMDKHLNLLPTGLPGELYVGGEGVSRGYMNRPELTREKFIKNPHGTRETLYRTGDLARLNASGDMEYLGRSDHQVKLRGFRIEPGEIESQLLKHEDINEAVVLLKDNYLTAYITAGREFNSSQLKEYLAKELPRYMIPSYFEQVERIPLTTTGKVDRRALESSQKRLFANVEYAAPETEIEKTIAGIWMETLNLDKVGMHHNFFDLGGNSLNIVKVYNKLKTLTGKDIPLVDLFQYPTIHSLSRYLGSDRDDLTFPDESIHGTVDMMEEAMEMFMGGENG